MSKELLGSLEINRAYQIDCLEGMKLIPDKSIDMILCDLPYGTTSCKWDTIIPFEPLWEQYERVIKDNGAIVLTASQPFTSALIMSKPSLFKEELIWVKHKPSNFGNAKIRHMKYHESVIVFSKKRYTYNPQMIERKSERVAQAQKTGWHKTTSVRKDGEEVSFRTEYQPKDMREYDATKKLPSSIIEIPHIANNSNEKTTHPTQKPVKLFEYLIKTYTNENEIVLDNCLGSGTTAVACELNNRKWIGFETESKYIEIINKRLEQIQLEDDLEKY